ncbi:MAG TPA: protein translocase subunit SecF [Candidatus Acidoferrales bacterium]
MEFFRSSNIDFLGKAKYFLILSAVLIGAGLVSLVRHRGPAFGIDFQGGTLVYVRFKQTPPLDQLRNSLRAEGLGDSEIQSIGPSAEHEVVIGVEQKSEGTQAEALDASKQAILTALNKTFAAPAGKLDLNNASVAAISGLLLSSDPAHFAGLGPEAAAANYQQMARAIADYRDKQRSGLIGSLDELKGLAGVRPEAVSELARSSYLAEFAVRNVEIVGPKVRADLRRQAVLATLYALAGMLVYIGFRFEWIYGVGAIIATLHDVVITLGFFSLFQFEISLTVIAALLTLIGYSMNDTIVVFDRIRENVRLMRREPLRQIINKSINQTLSRTILTSGLTFLTVLALFFLGGDVLRAFSFALVVGIVIGTYSSIAVASPVLLVWHTWKNRSQSATARARAGS